MDMLMIPKHAIGSAMASSLQAGPWGVLALLGLGSSVLIPITQYRVMYGFSVGYGASVALIALTLRKVFAVSLFSTNLDNLLTLAAIFYGTRLSLYLYIRNMTGWKPKANRTDPSRLARIPFSLLLSLLYSFMTCPMLYCLRHPPPPRDFSWPWNLVLVGTVLAWTGAVMEAIADTHKFVAKALLPEDDDNKKKDSKSLFQGPTRGLYAMTRHPNYTAEIIFWLGLWLAGLPSMVLSKSYPGMMYSSLGLYGIITIMVGASAKLEERHKENYGGQIAYEKWRQDVPAPLIPFVKG